MTPLTDRGNVIQNNQGLKNETGLADKRDTKKERTAKTTLGISKIKNFKNKNKQNKCVNGSAAIGLRHSKTTGVHYGEKMEKDKKVTTNKISCFYANARSIMNKKEELELYLTQEKPDIVGITETWLYNEIEDSEISVEGYTVFHKDREKGEKLRGGGVMILAKNELNISIREEIAVKQFLKVSGVKLRWKE